MTATVMWLAGMSVGVIFGAAWGYEAGRKSVVIAALPDEPEIGPNNP